jgi:hypothetical protein
MEPSEIFELIVKADEAIKYATADRTESRVHQARDLLDRAVTEAQAIGNQPLVDQARRRMEDLDRLTESGDQSGG